MMDGLITINYESNVNYFLLPLHLIAARTIDRKGRVNFLSSYKHIRRNVYPETYFLECGI